MRTEAASRPLPALMVAVVSCALLVASATMLLPHLGAALEGQSPAAVEVLFTVLLYGVLAGLGWAGRHLSGIHTEGRSTSAGQAVVVGAAIGMGGLSLALALAHIAGSITLGGPSLSAGALAGLVGTLAVVGQASAEELFFRGWLQPVLVRGWGPVVGIAIASVAFAGLHVAGGARGGHELVNLTLGAILFGLLALRSGGLWAPIAAHAGWNWSEAILFGLDPNPGVGSFGAVYDLNLSGSAWWGGSAAGLNSSASMTLVLAALLLPLLAARGAWPFTRTVVRD